jgi:hypothetical protein
MTLLEMKKLFRAYINDIAGDRWPDSGDVTPVTLLNRAQETIQDIIDEADEDFFPKGFDYQVTPTNDALEFNLPADFKDVIRAQRLMPGDTPVDLDIVTFSDRHDTPPLGYGAGTVYVRGTKLGVVAPVDSYTMWFWYTKRIPDLALDADVSEIPLEWHKLIVLQAARLAMASENREFLAWEGEYQQDMGRLTTFIRRRQRQDPRYVSYVQD